MGGVWIKKMQKEKAGVLNLIWLLLDCVAFIHRLFSFWFMLYFISHDDAFLAPLVFHILIRHSLDIPAACSSDSLRREGSITSTLCLWGPTSTTTSQIWFRSCSCISSRWRWMSHSFKFPFLSHAKKTGTKIWVRVYKMYIDPNVILYIEYVTWRYRDVWLDTKSTLFACKISHNLTLKNDWCQNDSLDFPMPCNLVLWGHQT